MSTGINVISVECTQESQERAVIFIAGEPHSQG